MDPLTEPNKKPHHLFSHQFSCIWTNMCTVVRAGPHISKGYHIQCEIQHTIREVPTGMVRVCLYSGTFSRHRVVFLSKTLF